MTGQNISTAVMQRRAISAPGELDYFPTPPWATRALMAFLQWHLTSEQAGYRAFHMQSCWEPACGEGHMVRPLREFFGEVRDSDVYQYGNNMLCDFIMEGRQHPPVDWIITNPPFMLAREFIEVALDQARIGVAMLVRSAFLEGAERHRELFAPYPPDVVAQFCSRVVMLKGRLIRDGSRDPFNLDASGRPQKARSATAYSWVIWLKAGDGDTRFRWLNHKRTDMERPGDYPDYTALLAELAQTEAAKATAEAPLLI